MLTFPGRPKFREYRKAPVRTKSAAKRWGEERERQIIQHFSNTDPSEDGSDDRPARAPWNESGAASASPTSWTCTTLGLRQPGEGAGFLLEPPVGHRIALVPDHLESQLAIQARVVGLVDDTDTARAELAADLGATTRWCRRPGP